MKEENIENLNNINKTTKERVGDYNKAKKEKIIIIIGIIVIIIIMIIAFFYGENIESLEKDIDLSSEYYDGLTYEEYENLSYSEREEVEQKKFNSEKNNLKVILQGLDINKKLMILLENNNDSSVCDFYVYTIFYNGENLPISVDTENIRFMDEASKNYLTIDKTPENFERYDFLITKENYYLNYISHSKDISFESYRNENGNIRIKGKNTSSSKIDYIIFSVIYYDSSNKILAINDVLEYEVGAKKEFEVNDYSLFKKETYEKVEYSRYEVILKSAYTY